MDFSQLSLTVAGWGKTRQGALTSSRYLLETKVKIVDGMKCRKSSIYRDNLVMDSMMCAYSLGKDACQVRLGTFLINTFRILFSTVCATSKCAVDTSGFGSRMILFSSIPVLVWSSANSSHL